MSKRNAELEKKFIEMDTSHKRLTKQLDQAKQDKANFKRLYEEEKRKRGQ